MNSLDFLANSGSGSENVSTNGASFEVNWSPGLSIKGAKRANLKTKVVTIWYNTPNILSGVNDTLYINDGTLDYELVFDQGLYDFTSFKSELALLLVAEGLPSDQITLLSSDATQKVIIRFNYATTTIDFTQNDTMRDILGFDSGLVTTTIGLSVKADNIAAFNTLEYYLIHCNLVRDGMTVNGKKSSVICRIPIPKGTSVGSQIVYEPISPTSITENSLTRRTITSAKFWLTDQDDNQVETGGEIWSVTISIEYL